METMIPKWLTITETGYPATIFGDDFAADAFKAGYKVYRADKSSGILNYREVVKLSDITGDE